MKSPKRQRLPSSIQHHSLMFKLIALFLFNKRECFDKKLDQRKAAKSDVPNGLPFYFQNSSYYVHVLD